MRKTGNLDRTDEFTKKMEVGTDSKIFSQSDAHPPFKYVFSHINNIKTPIRNLLSVNSVSDLIRVKSYYLSPMKMMESGNQNQIGDIV